MAAADGSFAIKIEMYDGSSVNGGDNEHRNPRRRTGRRRRTVDIITKLETRKDEREDDYTLMMTSGLSTQPISGKNGVIAISELTDFESESQ